MKTLLKIGYEQFLFPDEVTASKVLILLAKGISARDESWEKRVRLNDKQPEMSLSILPAGTKIVRSKPGGDDEDDVEEVRATPKGKARALPAPQYLALGDGR